MKNIFKKITRDGVGINSAYFIVTSVALVIFASVLIFAPKETWTKFFSGKSSNLTAVFSSTPNPDVYITNGNINAVVADNSGGAYFGGAFTTFGFNAGFGVPITATSGLPVPVFPRANNSLYAVIKDGSGGWYIGGAFTTVGTTTRHNIAHILPNGTVDPIFNPNLNGEVYALALSTSTNILYFGGQFGLVGATTRVHIAAVNATSGVVTGFDPGLSVLGAVYALAFSPDENTLYVGGSFSSFGGITRNDIAAYDIVGATTTNFNPDTNGEVYTLAPTSDGNSLYVGGAFTTIGTTTRHNLVAVDTTFGNASTTFNPDAGIGAGVFALALSSDESILYVGGTFTSFGGLTRNRLAAFDLNNATTTSFDPNLNSGVFALALSSNDTTLYLGGSFTTLAGGATTRNRIAAVNTSGVATSFNPNLSANVNALALSSNGNIIYAGGDFTAFGSTAHTRLAHIFADGSVDQYFDPSVNGTIDALAFSSSTLYLGGNFTSVNSTPRNHIAAVDTTTGSTTAFNPDASHEIFALALSTSTNTLYLGGTAGVLVTVGGLPRSGIAAVNSTTGSTTSFDPDANDNVYALTLSPNGNTLYLGGQFTQIGVASRSNIAAVDTTTGSTTAFDPSAGAPVYALALSGSTLYLGGNFTDINTNTATTTRNHIASVDTTTSLVTSFDPNVTDDVLALALSGSTLYIGGQFSGANSVGTSTRNHIAGVDSTTGSSTSFNPNANSDVDTLALSSDGLTLYAGGVFTQIGGISQPHFVSFPVVTPTPPPPTNSGRTTYIISQPVIPPTPTETTILTVLPRTGATPPTSSGSSGATSPTSPTSPGVTSPTSPAEGVGGNTDNGTATSVLPSGFCFNKNLYPSPPSDPDIRNLQIFLNNQGFTVTSSGSETNYYGPRTISAVISFQNYYANEILAPVGLTAGTGNFGNYTRKKANDILGCPTIFEAAPVIVPPQPKPIPTPTPEPTPTPVTPPEQTIPVIPGSTTATPTPIVENPSASTTPEPVPVTPTEPTPTNNISSNIVESLNQVYKQALAFLSDGLMTITNFITGKNSIWAIIGIVLGAILLILIFYAFKSFRNNKPGIIKDKSTNLPLSSARVKVFKEGMSTMPVAVKITDTNGKYNIPVPIGNYYIEIEKKSLDGTYTPVFKSSVVHIENGIINENLVV